MSHCAGRPRLYLALNGLGAASPEAHTSPTGAQVRRISWVFRGLGRLGGGSCLLIAAPSRPPIQKGAPRAPFLASAGHAANKLVTTSFLYGYGLRGWRRKRPLAICATLPKAAAPGLSLRNDLGV